MIEARGPITPASYPPVMDRRLVCAHGVGGGAGDFVDWPAALPGWSIVVPDLQSASADLAMATMDEYANVLEGALGPAPTFICGWSMGGLVALMVAGRRSLSGLVLIEPSLPAEVAGTRDSPFTPGILDTERIYGVREDGIPARPDSAYAARQRSRGIFVGMPSCPTLVIGGRDFGSSRAEPVAEYLQARLLLFPELSHVGLLHDEEVLRGAASWLEDVAADG
jgi:pimeloyl-ACP methyl ester carboxylesterase